jgi:hypothetical protein
MSETSSTFLDTFNLEAPIPESPINRLAGYEQLLAEKAAAAALEGYVTTGGARF